MFYKSLCWSSGDKTAFAAFSLKHFCDMKSKSCQPKHVDVSCVRAECHLCVYSSPLWHFISSEGVSLAFRPIDSADKETVPVSQQCTSVQLIRCSWEPEHWFSVTASVPSAPQRKPGCLSFPCDAPCAADNDNKTGQGCSRSKPHYTRGNPRVMMQFNCVQF